MRRLVWGLAAAGTIVLLADLWDDVQIVRLAQERSWDAFSMRMLVGHALREFLVVAAIAGVIADLTWALPLVVGAALHGLYFRTGWFLGSQSAAWLSPFVWVVLGDMMWRVGLLVWAWPRVPAFIQEVRGGEA